jgi:murein DD-endopeptidase MepM/ murein hydrolase activator NlpD
MLLLSSASAEQAENRSEPVEITIAQGIARHGYLWPLFVQGRVTSRFGNRTHPITGDADYHIGVDIHVPQGAAIRAANAGTVIFSGARGGYGNTVIVEHDKKSFSLYAHCERLLAEKGRKVYRGQIIATVGSTGSTTGPHLHFEIRIGSSPVNPLQFWKKHAEFDTF